MAGDPSNIYFSTNSYPREYTFDFNTYFFNEPSHLHSQNQNFNSFYIVDDKAKRIVARVHFFLLENGTAMSPFRSPFGSVEFNINLDLKILIAFINYFLEKLLDLNIQRVIMKSFPFAYDEINSTKLCQALLESGFSIGKSEINHHIINSKANYEKNLHKMELRKLKKSRQADLHISLEPASNLPSVYAFIKDCRNERNQKLSLQLSELSDIMDRFSQNYFIYTTKSRDKLVAATIIVKVNDRIWYNFYPASALSYNYLSPLVFMYKNIIEQLPEEIEIFDLGTSHSNDQPNFGLLKFKERLGGIASLKFTYVKKL